MNNIINETFTKHLALMKQHLKLMNESVTGEFKVEVDLVGRPDTSIDVTVEGDWEETGGIGHYDYGDQKAYDSSSGKYIEITSYDWDKTGYTPAEIKIVNKAIDDQRENWAEELTDRHY